jgi:hypothetical protein
MRRASALALLFVLGIVACHRESPTLTRDVATVSVSTSAAPSSSASEVARAARERARAFFASYSVGDGAPARRVLYSWTTADQIDELVKTKVLLSRAESPTFGPSGFDRVLAARPPTDDVARLLRNEAFAKKRFAWPAPWATIAGLGAGRYGDRLLEIELADDAIVAKLAASGGAWELFDLDGKRVDEKTLLAHPERLAAVYFVNDVVGPDRPAYREFVLCNESRIASWSVGDEASAALLARAAIEAPALAPDPIDVDAWTRGLPTGWRDAGSRDAVAAWSSSLAFATVDYAPTPAQLDALAALLRAAPRTTPPMTYRPKVPFALTYRPARPLRPPVGPTFST